MTYQALIDKYSTGYTYPNYGVFERAFPTFEADTAKLTFVDCKCQYSCDGKHWHDIATGASFTFDCDFLLVRVRVPKETPEISDVTINLTKDSELLFAGIVGIPSSPVYSTGFEDNIYSLEIQSLNALMQRRLVTQAYRDITTTDLVKRIFEMYIKGEGITPGRISNIDFTYTNYTANLKYVGDVLDELVAPVGATWHISKDKKFYFVTKDDFLSIPAPTHLTGIQKSTSGLDVRTVQTVAGATARTSLQTKSYTWIEEQSTITLTFPLAASPTCYINGTEVDVGIKGVENDDITKVFLWSAGKEVISLNTNATTQPAIGDVVKVEFYGIYEIQVELQNDDKIAELASITGTSGRIEKVVTGAKTTTKSDTEDLTQGLLDRYGEENETITCFTDREYGTEPLTIWTFDLPDQNIEGEYIVTGRTMDKLGYTLTLQNKQYYMKYGAIYSDYDANILSLSVNESVVIIKTLSTYKETLGITENYRGQNEIYYPNEWTQTLLNYPMEALA